MLAPWKECRVFIPKITYCYLTIRFLGMKILLLNNNRISKCDMPYCYLTIGMDKWTSLLLNNNRIFWFFFTYCYLTIGFFEIFHLLLFNNRIVLRFFHLLLFNNRDFWECTCFCETTKGQDPCI